MTALTLELLIACAAGVALGLLFLLALWHSLQRLPRKRRPGLWLVGGMALRIAGVAAVLFAIMQLGDWRHAVAAIAGFTLARWLVARRVIKRKDQTAGEEH